MEACAKFCPEAMKKNLAVAAVEDPESVVKSSTTWWLCIVIPKKGIQMTDSADCVQRTQAVVGLIVNPVNSVVPAMCEMWKKKGGKSQMSVDQNPDALVKIPKAFKKRLP